MAIMGTFFNNSCNYCRLLCLLRRPQRNPQFVVGVDSLTIPAKYFANRREILLCEFDAIVGQLVLPLLQLNHCERGIDEDHENCI